MRVNDASVLGKSRRFVKSEDGGEAWSINLCFYGTALDLVFDVVEEEVLPEEFEEIAFDVFGYVRLKVKEIEVQLIVDHFAFLSTTISAHNQQVIEPMPYRFWCKT